MRGVLEQLGLGSGFGLLLEVYGLGGSGIYNGLGSV